MNRVELEGVLAHELQPHQELRHPRVDAGRDAWSASSRSLPTSAIRMMWWDGRSRNNGNDGDGGGPAPILAILGFALLILAPLIGRG